MSKTKITKAQRAVIIEKLIEELQSHDEHERKQVGACVYCVTCNKRLYQGEL
jgi:heterodisulfide reductase subunit C